ncbi:FkbM family methyltransferase [Bradyrhizobium sp. U531]|uniref:FkbM family methyltransferase n=1 Tax=Bradyrhizobium sp. U531 TaxID=3053458 RepID=UPI003F42A904
MDITAFAKSIVRRVSHKFGVEVIKAPSLMRFLESREIGLVLDVGANIGQFARSLRDSGYDRKIVSFEPVESAFQSASEASKRDPKWSVRKIGLGENTGTAIINVTQNSVYSSVVAQTAIAPLFDASTKVLKQQTFDIYRLDDLYSEFSDENTFLKIDTQGFEKAVLNGARDSLAKILGIQLELPIEHLYENSWSFEEALAYMKERDFVLAQIRPTTGVMRDRASLLEFDCVFRRK